MLITYLRMFESSYHMCSVSGEMIGALQIKYNRTRQAVITTELIEIISGSVALETAD